MTLIEKIFCSSATILELRSNIFLPEKMVLPTSDIYKEFYTNKKKRVVQTDNGITVIKGTLLTQLHKDVIDAIMSEAKDTRKTVSGGVGCFIHSEGLISSILGRTETDKERIKLLLDEIQTSAIDFKNDQNKSLYSFKIISSFAYKEDIDSYYVEFSPEYCSFFAEQISVDYRNIAGAIIALQGATARKIVRYFLSFDQRQEVHIDELFEKIGLTYQDEAGLKIKTISFMSSLKDLSFFGIHYDPSAKTVTYRCDIESVKFLPPSIQKDEY